MVVLPLEEQAKLLRSHPKIFSPAKGAWGRRGSTCVRLELANKPMLTKAMAAAWQRIAGKAL
jgi:hypothetical protein